MAQSLANKYRPLKFEDVLSQSSTMEILKQQLSLKSYNNCYLFCGVTGTGKTTLARIFANEINQGKGSPIEIDGASNNGVDNVKSIIISAKERAIDAEYKIYIIDEAHAITTQGWQAFLKCIEEPPQYTIFIFCTTNPEKVPPTIQNRVMRFNLSRIGTQELKDRLISICQKEGFLNYIESCDYIAKLAQGGARDAIAMLEKCSTYSKDLTIKNTLECLGNFSYNSMFDLTNALIDGNEEKTLQLIDEFYNSGKDLKLFIDQYLDFVLDLTKYCLFRNIETTKIPFSLEEKIKYTTAIENNLSYFNSLTEKVLNIKNTIKNDSNNYLTIEVMLTAITRGDLKC